MKQSFTFALARFWVTIYHIYI